MICPQQISHIIRQGDNLYRLAQYYKTTVPGIISLNPGIDPYNLQIGRALTVCPGTDNVSGQRTPGHCPSPEKQMALINIMRLRWSQHIYWTRMLLIGIAERLNDQSATAKRLLQNPGDIAAIYNDYYSAEAARVISQLLTEHLQIGAELITALRDRNTDAAERLNREWYTNAEQIASALSGINPYYSKDDLREMLYQHLNLTKQEVAMRLAGNYEADVAAFDAVEREALAMADYLSSGIMRQFPQSFS